MAKGNREIVALICTVCKSQNYVSTRNKVNMEEKLVLKKWCNICKLQRDHKESTKLK
jgi:large subunit ribosomal protein L33